MAKITIRLLQRRCGYIHGLQGEIATRRDGSSMNQIDAAGILDIAMSVTAATLLERRWESAFLVNVGNNTLSSLMANAEAMKALMNIERFRTLNQDIGLYDTIFNTLRAYPAGSTVVE